MALSSVYYANMMKNFESYNDPSDPNTQAYVNKDIISVIKSMVILFVLILIVDLIIMFWGIYSVVQVSQRQKWAWYIMILLILLLFVPIIGFILCIVFIVLNIVQKKSSTGKGKSIASFRCKY